MRNMKALNVIALALTIIGGLNWGLIALFGLNIVAAIFGPDSVGANIVYGAFGLASLYSISLFKPVVDYDDVHPVIHERTDVNYGVRK